MEQIRRILFLFILGTTVSMPSLCSPTSGLPSFFATLHDCRFFKRSKSVNANVATKFAYYFDGRRSGGDGVLTWSTQRQMSSKLIVLQEIKIGTELQLY
jgi:hypothetical protein